MASGYTPRMLGVCMALLLCSAANAAMLTGSGPGTASRGSRLQAGWVPDALPSGTSGGALGQLTPHWSLDDTPTAPGADRNPPPTFNLRPMLGGFNAEFRGGALFADQNPPSPVPLPAALWLLGSGAAAMAPLLRRRSNGKRQLP